MFMTKDKPISTPSTKSVIEKPKYSKCRNRPINIPNAREIMPIASMFSSLSCSSLTLFLFSLSVIIRLVNFSRFSQDMPVYLSNCYMPYYRKPKPCSM